MKKIFLLLCLFIAIKGKSQNLEDSICTYSIFGNVYLYSNYEKISVRKAKNLAKHVQDSVALKYFRKAYTNRILSDIIGVPGSLITGLNIGNWYFWKNDMNKNFVILGAGLLAISIPFEIASNRNLKKGVRIYNDNLVKRIRTKQ